MSLMVDLNQKIIQSSKPVQNVKNLTQTGSATQKGFRPGQISRHEFLKFLMSTKY